LPGTQSNFTQAVFFSGDGRTLISASSTGIIQSWDIAQRREIASRWTNSDARWRVFSRDGRFATCWDIDATVRVWDGSKQ
jgi:WD40 repeat protein